MKENRRSISFINMTLKKTTMIEKDVHLQQ